MLYETYLSGKNVSFDGIKKLNFTTQKTKITKNFKINMYERFK